MSALWLRAPHRRKQKLTAFKTAPAALKTHVGSQPLRVSFEEPLAETTSLIVAPREGELAEANVMSHDEAIGSSASALPIEEGKLSTLIETASGPMFEPAAREGQLEDNAALPDFDDDSTDEGKPSHRPRSGRPCS